MVIVAIVFLLDFGKLEGNFWDGFMKKIGRDKVILLLAGVWDLTKPQVTHNTDLTVLCIPQVELSGVRLLWKSTPRLQSE